MKFTKLLYREIIRNTGVIFQNKNIIFLKNMWFNKIVLKE